MGFTRAAKIHGRYRGVVRGVLENLRIFGWKLSYEGIRITGRHFCCVHCDVRGDWFSVMEHLKSRTHCSQGLEVPTCPKKSEREAWSAMHRLLYSHKVSQ